MGLLDSVIGGLAGGRGQSASGGMSPLTKALLALLAAKAASSYLGRSGTSAAPSGGTGGQPAPAPSGKVESGILAGIPSLDSLFGMFRSAGHEDKLQSWIGAGPNKTIQPDELGQVLGRDTLDHLQRESGLSRGDLLSQLSTALPGVIDKLTPHGRVPTPDEHARW